MNKSVYMRFKVESFKTEDGENKIRLDKVDNSDCSGFEFYEDELDDVIKVLQFFKEIQ